MWGVRHLKSPIRGEKGREENRHGSPLHKTHPRKFPRKFMAVGLHHSIALLYVSNENSALFIKLNLLMKVVKRV